MGTELVGQALTDRGELVLRRRGEHYELLLDGIMWLATYDDSAERALVGAAVGAVAAPGRVLLSGLGMGFVLRAVLAAQPTEQVTVLEPLTPLIHWNQQFIGTALGGVQVVGSWADLAGQRFHVILLEDGTEPLDQVRGALAPGGVAAAWRPARDAELLAQARRIFGHAEERPLPSGGAEPDYLYLLFE